MKKQYTLYNNIPYMKYKIVPYIQVESKNIERITKYACTIYVDGKKLPGIYSPVFLEKLEDEMNNSYRYVHIKEFILTDYTPQEIKHYKEEYNLDLKKKHYAEYEIIFDKKYNVVRYRCESTFSNIIAVYNNILMTSEGYWLLDDTGDPIIIYKKTWCTSNINHIVTAKNIIVPENEYCSFDKKSAVVIDNTTGIINHL